MSQHPKIYVAGHRGMVGSAIVRQLLAQGHPLERIITRTPDVVHCIGFRADVLGALCLGKYRKISSQLN